METKALNSINQNMFKVLFSIPYGSFAAILGSFSNLYFGKLESRS